MATYESFRANIAQLISKYGISITITYADGKIVKTPAVFVTSIKESEQRDTIALFSQATVGSDIAYITAVKVPPQPGDLLTGKDRSYRIQIAEVYKPAGVVIAYKLTLT